LLVKFLRRFKNKNYAANFTAQSHCTGSAFKALFFLFPAHKKSFEKVGRSLACKKCNVPVGLCLHFSRPIPDNFIYLFS